MARSYAPLLTSIWSDDDFVALTPGAQRFYFLAMSQPNITYCGVVPFTARRWARMAAGTTTDDVDLAVEELEDAGFVVLDDDTEELWVRSFVRHNGVLGQPQLAKAMDRAFDDILSDAIRAQFLAELPADLPKACVTLLEALSAGCDQGAGSLPAGTGLKDLDLNPEPEPSDDDAGDPIPPAATESSSKDSHQPVWIAYAELVADAQAEPPVKRTAFLTKVAATAARERRSRLVEYLRVDPTAGPETYARWLYDDIDPVHIERPELDEDFTPASELRVIA